MAENKWIAGVVSPQTKWSYYWFWGPPCKIVVIMLEHVGTACFVIPGSYFLPLLQAQGRSFSLSQVQIKTAEKAQGPKQTFNRPSAGVTTNPYKWPKIHGFHCCVFYSPRIFLWSYFSLWKLVTLGTNLVQKNLVTQTI